jgi:hypothetical protein
MRVPEYFSKIFAVLVLINPIISSSCIAAGSELLIERKEDELLLPPYLRGVEGGILNITSERTSDENNKRSALPGEWLDYGDVLSLPDRMGIYVQMNEGMQWVGGGVFEGKLLGGKWNPTKPAYEMVLNRGWMKIWAKPSSYSGAIQIKTPKVTLVLNEGVVWVSATAQKTELYVLMGTVKMEDQIGKSDTYYEWSGAPGKLQKSSQQWDFVSLEKRISDLYPNLVKLSHRANSEWLDEVSSKKYAEMRSKGWKKVDRYFPSPTPKK